MKTLRSMCNSFLLPEDIYRNINESIKLGVFSDASEAVVSALKKAYARKSRSFLRWLMIKEGITENKILQQLRIYLRRLNYTQENY